MLSFIFVNVCGVLAAFLSVVLITEMLEICIQTSYDQNIHLILKSYFPVVYGTTLRQAHKNEEGLNQIIGITIPLIIGYPSVQI
jgi:hypothetical protein